VLDMAAAVLSAGRAAHDVPADPELETGLSQVFIAIDASTLASGDDLTRVVDSIIASLQVRFPGQRTAETRARHSAEGIPVDPSAWRFARACASGP
jgi:3-dehydro-L-gulonate 2-dehydrogenase